MRSLHPGLTEFTIIREKSEPKRKLISRRRGCTCNQPQAPTPTAREFLPATTVMRGYRHRTALERREPDRCRHSPKDHAGRLEPHAARQTAGWRVSRERLLPEQAVLPRHSIVRLTPVCPASSHRKVSRPGFRPAQFNHPAHAAARPLCPRPDSRRATRWRPQASSPARRCRPSVAEAILVVGESRTPVMCQGRLKTHPFVPVENAPPLSWAPVEI